MSVPTTQHPRPLTQCTRKTKSDMSTTTVGWSLSDACSLSDHIVLTWAFWTNVVFGLQSHAGH
eukprot:2149679-Prymnesium_polylepis.1